MGGKRQQPPMEDSGAQDLIASRGLYHELDEAHQKIEELQGALESRVVIEQAKGVLHERFGWPVGEAIEILRYAARSSRTNIHALAAEVVVKEETPNSIVIAIARTARWRAAHMRERAETHHARVLELETLVRQQQERLAWERREKVEHRGAPRGRRTGSAEILDEVVPTAQVLHVDAPSYESARALLEHVLEGAGDEVHGELEYGQSGSWQVRLRRPELTAWTYGSDELLGRVLVLVQAWVDEVGFDTEIAVGERRFLLRPR
jgi:hypothetical protein